MKRRPTQNMWYGIRSVFLFGKKNDGTNVFEERIVAFSAKTVEKAFAKAQKEAEGYATLLNMKRHPLMEAYTQDGDKLIDGYEVWSVLYESRESLNSFVNNRYVKYEYHPDEHPRPFASRAKRASRKKFERALSHVPDVEPDEQDRL